MRIKLVLFRIALPRLVGLPVGWPIGSLARIINRRLSWIFPFWLCHVVPFFWIVRLTTVALRDRCSGLVTGPQERFCRR